MRFFAITLPLTCVCLGETMDLAPCWGENRSKATERNSNLPLALASTVVLGFGPHWDPWAYFCSFQDHIPVLKWGLLFDEWKGPTTAVYYRRLFIAIRVYWFTLLWHPNYLGYLVSRFKRNDPLLIQISAVKFDCPDRPVRFYNPSPPGIWFCSIYGCWF
jgi:hypothetical protein